MLYLKYRPQTIADLDNSTAAAVVANILASGNIPHALLFTGQKGTGKTSTARIFAKSINCLSPQGFEPCNKCANCLSIDASSSPDVFELDAASNRGIEEIRALIRESAYAPMQNAYRVFIIDEAHMITNDAFNALLKTLEEPPEKVIFILATTNEEKIPKTIASRCLRVYFGHAKKEDIISKLKKVVAAERLVLDEAVLELIADSADRSFRDAIKLLEELVIQKKTSKSDALLYFGVRTKGGLLQKLESADARAGLAWIEEFVATGGSSKSLIESLLEELRLQMLAAHNVTEVVTKKTTLTKRQITILIKLLQDAYASLRFSPIESLPLEIAVVEFYNQVNPANLH